MDEHAIENMVRLGTVSAVNPANRKARVIFQDKGMTSGWLYVLRYPGLNVQVGTAQGHSHDIPEVGQSGTAGEHSHTATVYDWMPQIGNTVVVLYLPIFNSDGFILGAI